MVLRKRQRNGEFIAWNPPTPDQPQMSMSQPADSLLSVPPEIVPPTKKTRTTRSSSKATTSELPAKTPKLPAVKKARASRAKQAPATSQSATPPVAVTPEAGPSQTAAPPPKKGRKKAAPAADSNASHAQPEKRGAVFKPHCPQNILDRVERVMTQRCVLTSRFRSLLHLLTDLI